MNWFVSNADWTPATVDACILALVAFCAFFAALALVAFVAVAFQTWNGLRSSDLHGEDHQLGESKRLAPMVPAAGWPALRSSKSKPAWNPSLP